MKDQDRVKQPPTRGKTGVSRRAFLKGSGAAAAATALASSSGVLEAQEQGAPLIRGARRISLHINGEEVAVVVEPRTTLLEVLRYQLNLTGAKPVATDGSCGASTVLVDGKPISAAITLALDCVGKKIQTVEYLADDPVPHAFVHNDAQQCGFCTPGFVVAVRAFLDRHPNATREEIRAGLNGNLCRCGTYYDVIEAALQVVKGGKSNG
jgi:xanthine dehydrogenase YagT iron-sulfur-binding subunit